MRLHNPSLSFHLQLASYHRHVSLQKMHRYVLHRQSLQDARQYRARN